MPTISKEQFRRKLEQTVTSTLRAWDGQDTETIPAASSCQKSGLLNDEDTNDARIIEAVLELISITLATEGGVKGNAEYEEQAEIAWRAFDDSQRAGAGQTKA